MLTILISVTILKACNKKSVEKILFSTLFIYLLSTMAFTKDQKLKTKDLQLIR